MEKKVEGKNSSTCFKQKRGCRKGKKIANPQQRKRKLQKNEKKISPILKENVGERKKRLSTHSQKKEIKGGKIVRSLQIMIFFYEVCDLTIFCFLI
jgi:hypothetical protein